MDQYVTAEEVLRRRHHLPHWQMGGSCYSLTFRSGRGDLPEEARRVAIETILTGHSRSYALHAAVAMPDHVHAILCPLQREPGHWHDLAEIMKTVKGVSARRINQALASSGTVWYPETYDRIIRDADEYLRFLQYMMDNPVKAGLVGKWDDYEFAVWPALSQDGRSEP